MLKNTTSQRGPIQLSGRWRWFGILAGLSLCACEVYGDLPIRDLGDTREPLNSADVTLESPPASTPIASDNISDFIGNWVGTAEDPFGVPDQAGRLSLYHFPSGSTQVRLEVSDDENWPIKLRFGAGGPVPPATDPNAGYPDDEAYQEYLRLSAGSLAPFEGFDYNGRQSGYAWNRQKDDPASGGRRGALGGVFNDQLNVSFSTDTIIDSWCALQTANSCDTRPFYSTWSETDDRSCWYDSEEQRACGRESPENWAECYANAEPSTPVDCNVAGLCNRCACRSLDADCGNVPIAGLALQRTADGGLVGVFNDLLVFSSSDFVTRLGTVRFHPE